jgi:hypothetical protein
MFRRPECFQKWNRKKVSPIQQHEKREVEMSNMSISPCSNKENFLHHCNLSGHWEAKCWTLHPKLHPKICTTGKILW